MEPVKPDYGGPERARSSCPRSSACARSTWLPDAGRRRPRRWCCSCSTAWAGRPSQTHPERAARARGADGRPDHDRRAVDHARRAHLDHHRARRRRGTASPASGSRVDDDVLNVDPVAAGRRQAAARPRRGAAPRAVPRAGRSRWSPSRSSAPAGFTGAHLRGADFHGWQTTVGARRARAARSSPAARRSSTRTTRASTRSRTRSASHDALLHRPSSRPPTGSSARCSTRCPTTPRSSSPPTTARSTSGPTAWIGLGALDGSSTPTPGDGRFRYLHARDGRGRRARRRRASELVGDDAGSSRASELLDEGWLGPDPSSPRPAAASATSCSRPATRSASSTRRCRARRGLRSAHGSLTRRRDAGPARRRPRAAAERRRAAA